MNDIEMLVDVPTSKPEIARDKGLSWSVVPKDRAVYYVDDDYESIASEARFLRTRVGSADTKRDSTR